jgi:hypothetical protein
MKLTTGTKTMSIGRNMRVPLAAAALAAGLLTGPLMLHHADASLGVCRTDPVIGLSDGTRIQVETAVQDVKQDVKAVTYTVHVPAGSVVSYVQYGGGYLKHLESVQVEADNASNTFDVDTLASTGTPGFIVSSTTTVVDGQGHTASTTTTGTTGTDLLAHLSF